MPIGGISVGTVRPHPDSRGLACPFVPTRLDCPPPLHAHRTTLEPSLDAHLESTSDCRPTWELCLRPRRGARALGHALAALGS